jgi:hypothetical protein
MESYLEIEYAQRRPIKKKINQDDGINVPIHQVISPLNERGFDQPVLWGNSDPPARRP